VTHADEKLCMCVCVCVRARARVSVHTFTHAPLYTRVYMGACVNVCIVQVSTRMYPPPHTRMYPPPHVHCSSVDTLYVCVHVCTCVTLRMDLHI